LRGLELIPAPGIRQVKQAEMHKKWRKYVPPEYRNHSLYADPGEDVQKAVKRETEERAEQRKTHMNNKRKRSPKAAMESLAEGGATLWMLL
jgi:hypothetical protein